MTNPLKAKFSAGQPVLGLWSVIPSATHAEVMGRAGLDFQILDGEHGAFDLTALEHSIRACECGGCSPLVRVPGLNPNAIQSALDLGAHGIVVPQVADLATAQKAVAATRFPPLGNRGYNPFTRAAGYDPRRSDRLDNSFPLSAIIVETLGAYQDLEAIAAIEALDLVYLGIYDMAMALGCEGDVHHPKVDEFVDRSLAILKAAGKPAGLLVHHPSEFQTWVDRGVLFLVYMVDTYVVGEAVSAFVTEFRQAGQASGGPS